MKKEKRDIIVKVGADVQLPHNIELEKDVLGSILIVGANALPEVEGYLTSNTFYNAAHKAAYSAIECLNVAHKPIDTYNLAMEMQSAGTLDAIGGPSYIASLTRSVASTAHLAQHAQVLRQLEIQRGIFMLSEKAKAMSTDPTIDAQETIETVEKGLTELQMNTKGCALSMNESISQFYEWVQQNSENKHLAICTGLNSLDSILNGGFHAPDLIVIGARPSVGKTAFATFFARNAAEQGRYVYFVSIEMTAVQLVARMVARDGISYANMRQGCMGVDEWRAMDNSLTGLGQLRINIADSPECRNLSYIISEARSLKRKGQLDIMFIDYLGLIRTNQHFEKRYIEVGYITGELKSLAKELRIPIILLAQLSRPQTGTEKKAPTMECLRESGDIEQDADIIIFPHRPYLYDREACDERGVSWKDRGVLLVEKNREGMRNVRSYFMHDPQFKDFYDDEPANEFFGK